MADQQPQFLARFVRVLRYFNEHIGKHYGGSTQPARKYTFLGGTRLWKRLRSFDVAVHVMRHLDCIVTQTLHDEVSVAVPRVAQADHPIAGDHRADVVNGCAVLQTSGSSTRLEQNKNATLDRRFLDDARSDDSFEASLST